MGAEISLEMPPVALGNEFVPPYLMDAERSYLDSPLNVQGLISNSISPVDQEFFDSVGWR